MQQETKIRVAGGWQKINVRERMKRWFQDLKVQGRGGIFARYGSYEDWEKDYYGGKDSEYFEKQPDL